MQKQGTKNLLKFLLRLIAYFLLAIILVNLYNFWPVIYSEISASDISVPQNISNPKNIPQINVATPTELIIPSLGIDTKILPVGVTKTGNLDVPNSLKNLGWYEYGPRPGQFGNAVIDGHQVDSFGLGVIFKNLYLLKPGDNIFVQTIDGQKLEFSVTNVVSYKYDQAPLQTIFGPIDKQNLNLITCDGNWIPGLKIKDKRLVVYSTLKM